jgi:peptidase M23-like protein
MKRLVALLPVLIAFQAGAPPALAWTWPADGPVLRPFVLGDDPYAGGQHRGIDVAAATDAPVRSPAAGVVSFAGMVPGGGRVVTVETPDGYSVTLVHLGSIAVARAALISEGETVGSIGQSGDPEHAEPYLHLGVRLTADQHGYVDPLSLLPQRTEAPTPAPEPVPAVTPPAQPAPSPTAPSAAAPTPETPPPPRKAQAPVQPADAHAVITPGPVIPTHASPGAGSDATAETHPRRIESGSGSTGTAPAPPGSERTTLRTFDLPVEAPVEVPASPRATTVASPAARSLPAVGVGLVVAIFLGAVGALVLRRRQVGEARATHAAALVLDQGASRATEDTRVTRSAEHDRLVLDRDLERVPLREPEALPDLDRDHDATELIQVANDPCCRLRVVSPRRFHRGGPRPPSRCRGAEAASAR